MSSRKIPDIRIVIEEYPAYVAAGAAAVFASGCLVGSVLTKWYYHSSRAHSIGRLQHSLHLDVSSKAGGTNGASDEGPSLPETPRFVSPGAALTNGTADTKMVLVVRMDLRMGRGKIAAQCCHAAVALWKKMWRAKDPELRTWECGGKTKICLQAESEQELRDLKAAAKEAGIPTILVKDAGLTQIAPHTNTVLALGPASAEKLDRVTGHLKLL